MKNPANLQLRRDFNKLVCLFFALAGTLTLFIINPALSTPILLSLVMTTLLSPWATSLERTGYPRARAIALIFSILFTVFIAFGLWGYKVSLIEWTSLKEKAPEHFDKLMKIIKTFEIDWQNKYPIINTIHLTSSLLNWGGQTGRWFIDHGPGLMGQALTSILIVPPLSFVLLNEGRSIRRAFLQLVPNRYFESFFMIANEITRAISDYVRAKLIEAVLLGLMVTLGLMLIHAPYTFVLGAIAGITNILPYLGPALGAIPGLFAITLDPHNTHLLLSVFIVYGIANLLDTIVVFPLVVAKLVNLHPLLLIAVVAIGQQYYGLVGMLISIPIATALKVVLQEIYKSVYEH